MQISRKAALAATSAAALAGASVPAVSALGHGHAAKHAGKGSGQNGATVLESALAPTVPADPPVHTVPAGAVPWQLKRGSVNLRHNGRVRVEVRGLVIPALGTPGPVTTINASLYCGSDPSAAATTATVPISRAGNARVDDRLTLPAKCLGAVVLVHPNPRPDGTSGAYIAASGFQG
jgi:hypothetical protein